MCHYLVILGCGVTSVVILLYNIIAVIFELLVDKQLWIGLLYIISCAFIIKACMVELFLGSYLDIVLTGYSTHWIYSTHLTALPKMCIQ